MNPFSLNSTDFSLSVRKTKKGRERKRRDRPMWREESDSEWQKQEERGIERRETVMERE